MSGKGDWIPGTNDAAYRENYPTIDWTAREREADAEKLRKAVGAIEIVHDDPSPEGETP